MLLGQYEDDLENGCRLTVPVPYRGAFAEGVYVTQGFEKNLMLMTDEAFRGLYQRVIAMNMANPLARLLLRMILGNASRVEMDESGRIQIPRNLVTFAGLEKAVMLVGQGDYVEVWAPALWEKQSDDVQNAEANAERFSMLDLAIH